MSLPILPSHRAASTEDLIRYFYKVETEWGRQVGLEEETLDCGVAIANRDLSQHADANQVVDAALPDGVTASGATAEAEAFFNRHGTRPLKWVMNVSAPPARTQPLVDHIVAQGFTPRGYEIFHLAGQPSEPITEAGGLTIIPARAAYKHTRALAEQAAAYYKHPPLADAIVLHIEDPAVDAILAMKDGAPAGYVSILTVGEIGYVSELFVAEPLRNHGVGRTLMSRTIEVCARAMHKHVFVGVDATNAPAAHLYTRFGFARIGTFAFYSRTGL
jgi:ribosomal protein S18 acetylase RimI-like enzyme